MMHWITQNGGTLLVGLVVAAVLAGVILKMIRDKKNHKSSCGCSCSGCPGASYCHKG